MARQDGFEVIFDGALYDRVNLASSAGEAGFEGSDATLLLRADLRLGDAMLPRLRGRFSAVIWNSALGALTALRDPLGIRPLYYTVLRDGGVIVSPHLHLLLRQPGVDKTIDPMVTAGMIAALPAAPEETAFAAVRRVPAGHLLRVRGTTLEVRRYWEPIAPQNAGGSPSERFGALLDQAVRRCHDGGRLGVLLSGGIDSATIGAAAARLSRARGLGPPCAISTFNPPSEASEEQMQRAVASGLGLILIGAAPDDVVPPGELLVPALNLATQAAWPPGILAPVADLLLERALESGCHTLLTGDGGDEWLLPLRSWAAERVLHLDLPALWAMARAWSYSSPGFRRGQLARALLWTQGARPLLRGPAARALSSLAPNRLRGVRGRNLTAGLPSWLLPSPARRSELVDWWIERSPEIPPSQLHRVEKRELLSASSTSALMEDAFTNGRRAGTEILAPFLDADLIGFLLSLPEKALIRGGRAKALARDYLAPELPFVESWPPKTLADPVIAAMVEREGQQAWHEIGGAPTLAELGVVDGDRIDAILDDHSPGSSLPDAPLLWDVMSLEAWLRSCMLRHDDA
jgi:asparagine synthase (glutamine-hydrolysing)